MKCVCGYEKIGEVQVKVPAKDILYTSGKNKGLVKKTEPAYTTYQDADPDKEEFYKIRIEKDFGFIRVVGDGWERSSLGVEVYACPSCGTLRIDV